MASRPPRTPHEPVPIAHSQRECLRIQGARVRRALTLFLIGVGVLLLPGARLRADSTPPEVTQEVEAAVRSAMQAWAYEEYWHLWDMGSSASRAALSKEEFTERMRRGNTRPAAGKQVEVVQVISSSSDSALVQVRFGLEDTRRPWAERADRPFLLRLEDGRWAVSLWDFVGLASYFPPDFFPSQPLIVPPPSIPRPKGSMR